MQIRPATKRNENRYVAAARSTIPHRSGVAMSARQYEFNDDVAD